MSKPSENTLQKTCEECSEIFSYCVVVGQRDPEPYMCFECCQYKHNCIEEVADETCQECGAMRAGSHQPPPVEQIVIRAKRKGTR